MEENKIFYIEKDGKKIKADIVTNFEIYGDHYCIYTTADPNSKNHLVYCAKIENNNLLAIEKEEEKRITDKIMHELFQNI